MVASANAEEDGLTNKNLDALSPANTELVAGELDIRDLVPDAIHCWLASVSNVPSIQCWRHLVLAVGVRILVIGDQEIWITGHHFDGTIVTWRGIALVEIQFEIS